MKCIFLRIFFISFLIFVQVQNIICQGTGQMQQINLKDSLSLHDVITRVLVSHPSVMKAAEAIKTAEASIGLARSAYLPNIYADAGYTRLGPVSKISIPQMGSFQIYPENNYNASAGISETLYDFSKTSSNIRMEESSKEISEKNVELVKQKLTLVTSVSFYTLVYLQEALKIRDLQLETLKKHLDFVTKKNETGSATKYEVLSTRVRISAAENQKVDVETAIKSQQSILNSLMGLPVDAALHVKGDFSPGQKPAALDSLIPYALNHRSESILAGLKEKHAELHLKSVKTQDYPVLSAFLTGGWKNGYIPDLSAFTANYAAGINLHVPVFEAGRRKNYIRMASAEINISKEESDQTHRDISSEVYQNESNLIASKQKIRQCELQVQQAQDALSLATVSFKNGTITNLDLLDAETTASESNVSLLKAKIDCMIDMIRLNISLGKKIE